MDGNVRSRPGRVLRATDVIPPYGNDASRPVEADRGVNPPACEAARMDESKGERKLHRMQRTRGEDGGPADVPRASTPGPEVPKYDLAENILAEHRRTAAKRRKSPGRTQPEHEGSAARMDTKTQVVEPPSQDPLEIRRLVAEIVARDIERLCHKPSKPLFGR